MSQPRRRRKQDGLKISPEYFEKIKIICDFLFFDQYKDMASFPRFEECFGTLTTGKETDLTEVFKQIVGERKKYITFRRMIKAYINWKKKISENYSFNYFMNEVFKKMIIKKGEVIGHLIEGERVFST